MVALLIPMLLVDLRQISEIGGRHKLLRKHRFFQAN